MRQSSRGKDNWLVNMLDNTCVKVWGVGQHQSPSVRQGFTFIAWQQETQQRTHLPAVMRRNFHEMRTGSVGLVYNHHRCIDTPSLDPTHRINSWLLLPLMEICHRQSKIPLCKIQDTTRIVCNACMLFFFTNFLEFVMLLFIISAA